MSKGNNHTYNEETRLVHRTDYDDGGRCSFVYDPFPGVVTHVLSVSSENQDEKIQWPNSNLWDD